MSSSFLIAVTTFFATLGPADLVLVYAALTHGYPEGERRAMALRATLVATAILLIFAVFGELMLRLFGITLPALRTAGGILLLLISIDMVFARHSGATGTTPEEETEAATRADLSVFPLAMPLIAGPGAISATILLTAGSGVFSVDWVWTVVALAAILITCWLAMLVAGPLQRLFGVTGLAVVSRVIGVLLAALSVQFLFDGIRTSGVLG